MAKAHAAPKGYGAYMVTRESENRQPSNGTSTKWLIPTLLSMLIGLVGVVYANLKGDVGKVSGDVMRVAGKVEDQGTTLTEHEAQLREIKAINALILKRLDSIDGKLGGQ